MPLLPKRIDELTQATSEQIADATYLIMIGDPTTGELFKCTRDQLVSFADGGSKYLYKATGSEGDTLTIATLAGKEILSIAREGATMYETNADPDSVEFMWDGTDITLGLAVQYANERFLIIYK